MALDCCIWRLEKTPSAWRGVREPVLAHHSSDIVHSSQWHLAWCDMLVLRKRENISFLSSINKVPWLLADRKSHLKACCSLCATEGFHHRDKYIIPTDFEYGLESWWVAKQTLILMKHSSTLQSYQGTQTQLAKVKCRPTFIRLTAISGNATVLSMGRGGGKGQE